MTQDLNTLLTALYVKIDDEIGGTRWMGRPPLLTDSELVCLAVAQALLGHRSEARWLRFARKHLTGMFPYLPQQSGYNKRAFPPERGHLGHWTLRVPEEEMSRMVMKVYSAEFKADAVALYLSDPKNTFEGVGKDLGISRETLRNWVRTSGPARVTRWAPAARHGRHRLPR